MFFRVRALTHTHTEMGSCTKINFHAADGNIAPSTSTVCADRVPGLVWLAERRANSVVGNAPYVRDVCLFLQAGFPPEGKCLIWAGSFAAYRSCPGRIGLLGHPECKGKGRASEPTKRRSS